MTSTAQFPDEQAEDGEFQRQEDAFRVWVSADGSSRIPRRARALHLYVSLACPWASRTLIMRNLKGLEDAIGVTVADPIRDDRGWAFRDGRATAAITVNGFEFLSEAYRATDPSFEGRVTVPVLWDKVRTRASSTIPRTTSAACSTTSSPQWRAAASSCFPPDIEPGHAEMARSSTRT